MLARLIVLILTLVLFPYHTAGGNRAGLAKENQLLREEWSLAKKSNLYVIFHLEEKIVRLKAKGITLREFPVRRIDLWGNSLPDKALTLAKKSVLLKPSRRIISPGDMKESEEFTLDVLELDDMPVRYTLVFDDRVFISVRPSEGMTSTFRNTLASLENLFVRPVVTFWYVIRGKHYTALDLGIEQQDARALYWSLSEGTKCIVYPE